MKFVPVNGKKLKLQIEIWRQQHLNTVIKKMF